MNKPNYGQMNITQLKNELKKRNAKLSGRKKELVERLESYDRNSNFGKTERLEPDFSMKLPSNDVYADVNSDTAFIGTTIENVQNFFGKFEKKFENRFIKLYEENFLMYFRVSQGDSCTYIKCSCRAEMKKSISYTVDVKIDSRGVVLETQCECAVGMGPEAHCKHVGTVMYGAVMFAKNKFIKTEETCTQQLQTFHHCKKFKGSPMKANTVHFPGADEFTLVDFDPRPEKYRQSPSYLDHFRNTWLNFPGASEMPIYQIFTPSNMLAVAHDHDYLQLTPEDYYLKSENISQIDDSEIRRIEASTKGQTLKSTWREERSKRLTSSMFGRICKCTDRTDKVKLAKSLTVAKQFRTNATDHGNRYESVAINRFMEETKKEVKQSGLVICKSLPFLAASPDGVIDKNELVEVKCPYEKRNEKITPANVDFLKQDDTGRYFIKEEHNYHYQIQGQLLCTGAKTCTLIVCLADKSSLNDIKFIEVPRDDNFIEQMVEKLSEFFETFFKNAILEKNFYKPYSE